MRVDIKNAIQYAIVLLDMNDSCSLSTALCKWGSWSIIQMNAINRIYYLHRSVLDNIQYSQIREQKLGTYASAEDVEWPTCRFKRDNRTTRQDIFENFIKSWYITKQHVDETQARTQARSCLSHTYRKKCKKNRIRRWKAKQDRKKTKVRRTRTYLTKRK